ncbi:MAG: DUF2236 domain-containing protein [Bacteroidia bacterium]|nr:DUF2236 domain-containing protein [Bacteroidia bacterium]
MEYFVKKESIVRKIWGRSDTILFIFAGASAEFALNKAVDWLYYTGKLPSDPIGRLFSTVHYARAIVFAPMEEAYGAIEQIYKIHSALEEKRGYKIPDWAYRDVLYMLIYYSISAYELLNEKLSREEKEEAYDVFFRVGDGMGLKDLPNDYNSWLVSRQLHLKNDLEFSNYTKDLFKQYRKHLGVVRYKALIEAQKLVAPEIVKDRLDFGQLLWLKPAIPLYKFSRKMKIDWILRNLLLPSTYKKQIDSLDMVD